MSFETVTIGPCVLYRGDCREVLPTLDADHCITDPPFAEETHAGARTVKELDTRLVTFDSLTGEELSAVFSLCGPVIRRWLVATIDWRHMTSLEASPPTGLRFVRFGIWSKPNGAPQFTGDRPATGWEAVAVLHREGGRMRWNGGGHRAVWTFNRVDATWHDTEKPVPLMGTFVKLFTDEEEVVLDPFMGIERDPRHFATACSRIREAWQADRSSLFPAFPSPT
jgi:site-specific DNA-methyltransferase (adenine-specific)